MELNWHGGGYQMAPKGGVLKNRCSMNFLNYLKIQSNLISQMG
ncbi:hypothetical protein SL69_05142 [Klebsiella pneumoniae]|nr:hypothetical protein H217_5056 [Klebsiella pneumoniae DMC0799]KMB95549.1 hypothetical protein SL69_05142 [Klebsiella pneumoniae]KMG59338.1 hypothetical protein SM56_05048 [Klebsiella pneumoniae]SAT44161.1 Uncharacterised protein [Klebsiella pneumoniae]SVZ19750.1 Uncharacterised protein [Klebsiella pneumoniae]